MEQALLFIEENQAWIYSLLLLVGLIYLRSTMRGLSELRAALFGLERESAQAKLTRGAAMLGLALAGLVTVFVVSTFLAPTLPAAVPPTPLPTVSFLETQEPGAAFAGGGPFQATPQALETTDSSGCQSTVATISSPESGSRVSGVVTVEGTANIPSFAFYKLEYRLLRPGEEWRAIYADTSPKADQVLGTWDTSLREPGEYQFRLVVTDTAGNGPMPCVIQLTVVPGT
jgi:hypothetical protein